VQRDEPHPLRANFRLLAIQDRLRAEGHEFHDLANLSSRRAAFLAAAPLIMDEYPMYAWHERSVALTCLMAHIPSRPLALRLHALLIAEGAGVRGLTADYCAGDALVGFCGSDRDLILEFAGDERLGLVRAPAIIALAKRRDLRVVPLVKRALRDDVLRNVGLEAIGLMRLHSFAPEVHESLHDADLTNRDQARKALKRLQDGKT
jgi:HEAT repeat protein